MKNLANIAIKQMPAVPALVAHNLRIVLYIRLLDKIMIAMHGTGQNSMKLHTSFDIILCQAIVLRDHMTVILLKVLYYLFAQLYM